MTQETRARPFSLTAGDIAQVRVAFEAAGFTEESVSAAVGVKGIASLKDVSAEVAWQRTSGDQPLHTLVRLFVIGGPVDAEATARALAPASVERLVAGGLLRSQGRHVRGAVKMVPFDDLVIAFDRTWEGEKEEAADHVMGPSDGARALANVTIRRPGWECLDLGAGCGFLSLLAARQGARVVATDVNPRAQAFVELNAALNGIVDIEAVTGDLFGAVAGRQFDLVFSNPPYVISPDNRIVYMSGGMTGDAFCRKIVAEVGPFLKEGGHFQMLCHWAQQEDEDWTSHLRAWFEGTGCDAWVLRSSTTEPRAYALTWMTVGRDDTFAEAQARLQSWLSYYEREHIHAIGAGVVTMRRRPASRAGAGWLRGFDGPPKMLGPCGDAILERMESLDLMERPDPRGRSLATDDEALLDAVFVVSPKARLTQECEPTPDGWTQVVAHVRIERGLAYVEETDIFFAELIVACDGQRTLRDAALRTLEALGAPTDSIPPPTAATVRQLVDEGFLVPVRGSAAP